MEFHAKLQVNCKIQATSSVQINACKLQIQTLIEQKLQIFHCNNNPSFN